MTDIGVDPRVIRTRKAVLTAAREVLFEEGWEHVTVARVAHRSGYGRATLYRHWPNRLDLLRDAIAEEARLTHAVLTGNTRNDLIDELDAFRRALDTTPLGHMVIAIAHQARTDPSFRELHDATRAEGTRVLRAVLEGVRVDDSSRSGLDVDLAISMLVGPLLHRHLFDTKRLTASDIEKIVDSFLAANGP
jgi:AcrR family transcriptional regulator